MNVHISLQTQPKTSILNHVVPIRMASCFGGGPCPKDCHYTQAPQPDLEGSRGLGFRVYRVSGLGFRV